MIIIIV